MHVIDNSVIARGVGGVKIRYWHHKPHVAIDFVIRKYMINKQNDIINI